MNLSLEHYFNLQFDALWNWKQAKNVQFLKNYHKYEEEWAKWFSSG